MHTPHTANDKQYTQPPSTHPTNTPSYSLSSTQLRPTHTSAHNTKTQDKEAKRDNTGDKHHFSGSLVLLTFRSNLSLIVSLWKNSLNAPKF
jgi:hypothetical protein